jgi:hypothetical protein
MFPAMLASESDHKVIAPPEVVSETELLTVMFPVAFSVSFPPLEVALAPAVIVTASTCRSPAKEIEAPELVVTVPPVEVRLRSAPELELLIALLIVTSPVASKVAVEAVVSWFWTEVGVTFETEELSVYQVPLIQSPVVSRAVEDETVTAVGILLVFTVSTKSWKPLAV